MIVGLCGNPNVGKSTLFNRLTGLRQHTGNWPGKTVGSAVGNWGDAELVDTPGSYSLRARSAEEGLTRDYILFSRADRLVFITDATNLQRSLLLALQVLELRGDLVLCVNLMDEARRRGIRVDTEKISARLGIPVVPMNAASGEGVGELEAALRLPVGRARPLKLAPAVQDALAPLAVYLSGQPLSPLWLARTLVSGDEDLCAALRQHMCLDPARDSELARLITEARAELAESGYKEEQLEDEATAALAAWAFSVCDGAVRKESRVVTSRADRLLTHPVWGTAVMLGLLSFLLWLTIRAANVPSEFLCRVLFSFGERMRSWFLTCGVSERLTSALCDGLWRTTAWVVGVMLPPMAIFFPLFTLLEDTGYLPRVAFNMDGAFSRCGACGKQGLCMLMGLGCNAVGVTGSRIIDSQRERLLAQLTNALIPCNGRFPLMLVLVTVFFGGRGTYVPALLLTGLVLLGVCLTFLLSYILSVTVLRGAASSFALELPPYRKPQWGSVILRSIPERTLKVLGRAVCVAAPAGLLIWMLANTHVGETSLLQWGRGILEKPGRLLCMDGAILLGFLLALPANEIALPAMLLIYSGGTMLESYASHAQLHGVLLANGWDGFTAAAVLLFSLCHWPCATTLLTIRKESGSRGWMILAAILPTLCGVLLCGMVALCRRFFVA